MIVYSRLAIKFKPKLYDIAKIVVTIVNDI